MKTKVILSQQMASAIIAAGQEEGVEFYSPQLKLTSMLPMHNI